MWNAWNNISIRKLFKIWTFALWMLLDVTSALYCLKFQVYCLASLNQILRIFKNVKHVQNDWNPLLQRNQIKFIFIHYTHTIWSKKHDEKNEIDYSLFEKIQSNFIYVSRCSNIISNRFNFECHFIYLFFVSSLFSP